MKASLDRSPLQLRSPSPASTYDADLGSNKYEPPLIVESSPALCSISSQDPSDEDEIMENFTLDEDEASEKRVEKCLNSQESANDFSVTEVPPLERCDTSDGAEPWAHKPPTRQAEKEYDDGLLSNVEVSVFAANSSVALCPPTTAIREREEPFLLQVQNCDGLLQQQLMRQTQTQQRGAEDPWCSLARTAKSAIVSPPVKTPPTDPIHSHVPIRPAYRRGSDESTVAPCYSRENSFHFTEGSVSDKSTSSSQRMSQQPVRPKLYSAIFGSMEQGSFLPYADHINRQQQKKLSVVRPQDALHSQLQQASDSNLYGPFQTQQNDKSQNEPEQVERPQRKVSFVANELNLAFAGHPESASGSTSPSENEKRNKVLSDKASIIIPNPKATNDSRETSTKTRNSERKTVKINTVPTTIEPSDSQPPEFFRPSCDAYTPRLKTAPTFKPAPERPTTSTTNMGSISRPNFRDALRRVAMIIQRHISKIERRFHVEPDHSTELFLSTMKDAFHEDNFITPTYKCTMVRVPVSLSGVICVKERIQPEYEIPTEGEIYEFAHRLFKTVQLSSECSIVCLIYIERLMEVAKVPLLGTTWRPIFMAGLLLASKVWQDLSSWNIEFASVYPQYELDAINRLELLFLKNVKWDLYISSRYVFHIMLCFTL